MKKAGKLIKPQPVKKKKVKKATVKFPKPSVKFNVRNTIAKKGGRPPLFSSVEVLQAAIDEYFEWCDDRGRRVWDDKEKTEKFFLDPAPYTMSGLARRLEMDRDTLLRYSHKDKFYGTIKEARERVQEDVETRLMEGKATVGAIFNLKNNFGWKDKTETEHSGSLVWKEEPPK